MSRRFLATAGGVLCALLWASLGLAAETKLSPQSSRANRFGVSPRVADLPEYREDPKSPSPEQWERANEELPWERGPYANVPSLDGALQLAQPTGGMPGPSLTFNGLTAADNASVGIGGLSPPDPNGDVGPNHYVNTVNLTFRVFDKSGVAVSPVATLGSLFSGLGAPCTQNEGDPIVLYDPLADRWLISQFASVSDLTPPFYQCIAVSQAADPTGAYFLYEYLMPNSLINDYPKFGVWPDGYYMTDNQFGGGGTTFNGAGFFAFDRSKMLVGDPSAGFIYFDVGAADPNSGGALPTDIDGLVPPPVGTPNLFMEYRADEFGAPADVLRIYEFRPDFATPASSTLTTLPDLPVAAFDPRQPVGRADVEQLGGVNLDAVGGRLMHRLAYRTLSGGVQSYVTNWTVNASGVNPTSAGTYDAAIRFTELRRDPGTGAISIQNELTWASAAGVAGLRRNNWMGSAAQDNQGNSALGFSGSGPTDLASIYWAGRLAGDAADTFAQGEALMHAATGSQTGSNRWGDYSAMMVDPADDCTFFYTQEYYVANSAVGWSTRVGKFAYAGCTAPPKGTLSGTITRCGNGLPLQGASIAVEGGFFRISDVNGDYSMDLPPGTYNVSVTLLGYMAAAGQVTILDAQTTDFDACLTGVPVLVGAGATLVAEDCDPGNGRIDPGETVTVNFCVRNIGGADTTNLVGDLQETGGVGDAPDPAVFGAVVAGGPDVCVNVVFTAEEALVCGDDVTATFDLEDGVADLGTAAYPFATGIPVVTFSENFDGVVAPALPAGWTASGTPPGNPWVTTLTNPDSSPNAAFSDDPAVVTDKRLDSPSIPISTAAAQVSFRNFYDLEASPGTPTLGYDGGVLEISIGGGPFQDILAAGGSFVSGGYNRTISGSFGNPLANRQAWSGNAGGYLDTVVDLPPAALGENVVLRWRLGSDSSVADAGWWIDGVSVLGRSACCTPIPAGLVVDQNPAAAPTALLNQVWEPAETVLVEPSYFNGDSAPLSLTGTASNLTGPAGATYTLMDSTANYGSIASSAIASCFGTGDCYAVSVDDPAVRPALHWDATMDEALSNGAAKTWTLHIGKSFADVPTDGFYPSIETILHNGITAGGACGGFCPEASTLRKQMAVFVLKAFEGPGYAPPAAVGIFNDVPASNLFAPWIEELFNRGVVAGCSAPGGPNYCPDDAVLRQQMAVFLLKTLEGSAYVPPGCTGVFDDVTCPSLFADWIEELAARGITGGCGVDIYCPTNPVKRKQMAVFLTLTFQLLLYGP